MQYPNKTLPEAVALFAQSLSAELPFVSLFGGLARTHRMSVEGGGAQTFPVSVDAYAIGKPCKTRGEEHWLLPESNQSAVAFFESAGAGTSQLASGARSVLRVPLRLVVWFNSTAFVEGAHFDAMRETSRVLHASRDVAAVLPIQDPATLFSAYSLDEATTQFLMPPYTAFGFTFTLSLVSMGGRRTCATPVGRIKEPC